MSKTLFPNFQNITLSIDKNKQIPPKGQKATYQNATSMHLLGLHALRASPVYPWKQVHSMSCDNARHAALVPHCSREQAWMQLPRWHCSVVWQSWWV